MPGITLDDPLFAANAGVATDWAEAKGTALVKLPANCNSTVVPRSNSV